MAHAAALCAQLPGDSRTVRASLGPEEAEALLWTMPVRVAVQQLNVLAALAAALVGAEPPDPIRPPESREPAAGVSADAYKARLGEMRARIRESKGEGVA